MFKNYLKVAFRNILKHKGYSLINIVGLSVGIAACLLLFLWVLDELSYDRYHKKADQIYRLIYQWEVNGRLNRIATTPAPLGPAMVNEFPEVQKAVRFGKNKFLVRYRDKLFYEYIFFADPEIFDVFTFPLVKGNPENALTEPNSILISEAMRDKYFGIEEPIGKTISLPETSDCKITGVFKNIPHNSHIKFNFLGSFLDYRPADLDQWGISNYYTYLLISKGCPLNEFKKKLPRFVEKYKGKKSLHLYKATYPLQPLSRIHLYSNLKGEIEPNSDIGIIYIFSAVALFILLIACLNYVNLSIAGYVKRTKEVGLRKVLGAARSQLVKQFLGESFIFSFISIPTAVLSAELFLPLFNSLSGKKLVINYFSNLLLLPGLAGAVLCVGFIAGILPALFISGLNPVTALKGMFKNVFIISWLRRFLVVFQFAISIVFIISTVVIFNQLSYMRNQKLGFDKENIVNIPIYSKIAMDKYETIKREFKKNSNVSAACASSFFPGKNVWNMNYWHVGVGTGEYPMISCIPVDHDFIDTFRLKLKVGRNFSRKFGEDVDNAYILNESAVKEFGWESPIGKEFGIGNNKGTVIGVVENFHFKSSHHEIKPAALYIDLKVFSYFSIRLSPGNIAGGLDFLKGKWQELVPDQAFEYSFLDRDYDSLYKSEMRLGKIFGIAAFLAIFTACIGLFGLAALTAEQRVKEIGIRKVLGASAPGIIRLLSKNFMQWVVVSNIIAWPIAWYVMQKWLQNFAYQTGIGIWVFLSAGLLALATALLPVIYKTIRASSINPVEVLKYE